MHACMKIQSATLYKRLQKRQQVGKNTELTKGKLKIPCLDARLRICFLVTEKKNLCSWFLKLVFNDFTLETIHFLEELFIFLKSTPLRNE